jgi:hypothetical protein
LSHNVNAADVEEPWTLIEETQKVSLVVDESGVVAPDNAPEVSQV